jgi:putative phage-type endonuclease
MDRKEWLRGRKKYIGGSDIAAILGLSRYRNGTDVFLDKISEDVNDEGNRFTHWGNLLEDVIADEYSRVKGLEVEFQKSPIEHSKHPFLAANIDRWVNNKDYVLECKTAAAYKEREWGELGSDQIPEEYLCQVAWYRAITNVNKVDIAVLIGGNDFRIYTYRKNKDFEDRILKIGHDFWINNVLKKVPPRPGRSDISTLYPRSNGKGKIVSLSIKQKIDKLKSIKEESKILEKTMNKLKLDIKEYMQDYDILVNDNGEVMASWKNISPKACLDLKRFKSECQDIYLKYVNYAKQSRIFLIK